MALLLLLCSFTALSQSNISGKAGLIYTPAARYSPDGNMEIGLHFFPGSYGFNADNQNPGRVLSMNLTVLPRFDININLLQLFSTTTHPVKLGLGDRQLDFKYLVLKETRFRPALAAIFSTPTSISPTLLTHALVATKHFRWNEHADFEISAGYGSPYHIYRKGSTLDNYGLFANMVAEKKDAYAYHKHYLEGPFGGISLTFNKKFGVMLEYDSRNVNAGVYVYALKNWVLQAGVMNARQVTFGSSYNFSLLKFPRRYASKDYQAPGKKALTDEIIHAKQIDKFENVSVDSLGNIRYEQRLNRNPFPPLYQLKQMLPQSVVRHYTPLFQGIPIGHYAFKEKIEFEPVNKLYRKQYAKNRFPFHRNGYLIDVWIQPYFNAIFGNFDKPVQSNTSIALQSQMLLLPGLSFQWGILFPLTNDLDNRPKIIRPGALFLNQFHAAGHHYFSGSAGFFHNDQYGLNVQYRYADLKSPWSFGAEAGLTGDYYYPGKGIYYGKADKLIMLVDAAYLLPNPDVTIKLSAGRYLAADMGARIDLIRQFSNIEIGFYATTTSNGSTIGFHLAIPIFPGKLLQGRHTRLRTADSFAWEYSYTRGYRIGERYRTGYQLDQLLRQYHSQYLSRQYRQAGYPDK
ncbi:Exopolysaccharide biosynthesis protein YbjH [Dyadobacter sp. SG02]|uniref:YjbH domain-containing protein n=1 Tax=Dyadobacter sp. SG02 TaxID=1855291 RepID=UPI0008CEAC58|nr:YjbH domain-containing protein [Dyadobacter sp. SG02]SEJ39337.1 Exopolysaccharide biosynthesis protein YbjH [Dyadobacter sp. SG02]